MRGTRPSDHGGPAQGCSHGPILGLVRAPLISAAPFCSVGTVLPTPDAVFGPKGKWLARHHGDRSGRALSETESETRGRARERHSPLTERHHHRARADKSCPIGHQRQPVGHEAGCDASCHILMLRVAQVWLISRSTSQSSGKSGMQQMTIGGGRGERHRHAASSTKCQVQKNLCVYK